MAGRCAEMVRIVECKFGEGASASYILEVW